MAKLVTSTTGCYVVKTLDDAFVLNQCVDPGSENCARSSDGLVNFSLPKTVIGEKLGYAGGNVHFIDLNRDTFPDATVADLDLPE